MKVIENTAATLAFLCIAGGGSQANATTVTIPENLAFDNGVNTDIAIDSTTPQFYYNSKTSVIDSAAFGTQNSGLLGGQNAAIDTNLSDYSSGSRLVSIKGGGTLSYLQLAFQNGTGQQEFGYASFDPQGGLTSITYQVAAVPEPASWALLIAGFGLMGVVAHRRRRRVAPLAA